MRAIGFRTVSVLLSSLILAGCASLERHESFVVAAAPVVQQPAADAITRWLRLADDGNAEAQFELAWAYDNGRTVVEDKQQAIFWYYQAASRGHANAQFNLGVLYAIGAVDATHNYKSAVEWFQRAAEQSYPSAQYQLANMYQHGLGVERSDERAREWFVKAADLGNMKAMIELGNMTASSEPETALSWYHQAAELGSKDAQFFIAGVYRQQGRCTEADSWLRRAAMQGHGKANEQLAGSVCETGLSS